MGIRTRISTAMAALRGEAVKLTAASTSIADEDYGWRQLGRNPQASQWVNINPLNYRTMLKAAHYLAQRNPLAKRIVGLHEDMTVGDGVSYNCGKGATQRLQEFVREWWYDVNDMDARLGRLAEALSRTGERIIPVQHDPFDGMTRLGFVDPEHIERVRYIPGTDIPDRVVRVGDPGEPEEARTWYVIRRGAQPVGAATTEIAGQTADEARADPKRYWGQVFLMCVNRSEGQERGYSDLLATSDWLDLHDDFMYASLDRAKLLNQVVWDAILEGADEAEIEKFRRLHGAPPTANTVRIHNEKVTWQAQSPQIGASEAQDAQKMAKEHIVGSYGIPLAWFGNGTDSNLATANTMQMPVLKSLRKRRKYIFGVVTQMVEFAVQCAVDAGWLSPEDAASMSFSLQAPELEDSKVASIAAAILALTNAIATAVSNGWISTDVARRAMAVLFSEVGIEYDPEDDAALLEKETKDREQSEQAKLEAMLDRARKAAAEMQSGTGGHQSGEPGVNDRGSGGDQSAQAA